MGKPILGLLFILLVSSCSTMRQQRPIIPAKELPENCQNLHRFLSNNWLKHRINRCHKNIFDVYRFCFEYKECILKLTKNEVIKLFGEPDEITDYGNFRYILDNDCSDKSLLNYYYLNIEFKQNLVSNVEGGEISIVE